LSHFSEIEWENDTKKKGVVKRVLVVEQEYIDGGDLGDASDWIQTSYNTRGGVHYAPNSWTPDDGVALRKNFARPDDTYDGERDAFISPKPFASWSLDEDTCMWESPVSPPDDGKIYKWNEDALSWVELE
tara:strand:- start:57 stop:446 length:390 start_codon:yes stop_codon:yes gene_type:complete